MLDRPALQPHGFSLTTVAKNSPARSEAREIAARWCQAKGDGWSLAEQLGVGGTAPVFEIISPDGPRALKIYDQDFSLGALGDIEHDRIQQQLSLQNHDCRSLVQVYEGGKTEERLYLLMSRAPGTELKKCLRAVPRTRIRSIVHEVARACLFLWNRDLCHRDIKAANIFVSDDFSHSTLLDISVIRDIHDPVGVGTDRAGQLPVLATARYCPPEYLFRLIEPGPALWHALTVYQLGALLHDLIMRVPLFQAEYEQAATNRYRFAWLVATKIPQIRASDIDDDLLFVANRALDKDWKRRSALRIEDFFHDSASRQNNAFQMLGMLRGPVVQAHLHIQVHRIRLEGVSTSLEEHLIGYFRKNGVTTTHQVSPGPDGDNSRTIALQWNVVEGLNSTAAITLQLTLRLLLDGPGHRFNLVAMLSRQVNNKTKKVTVELPDVQDDEHSNAILASQSEAAFATLATALSNTDSVAP